MALSRFVLPYADVGSGVKPSSGAQLFFFATGTSTPADTFNISTGGAGNENANPVIADSTGVFPDIFMEGTFKVVLKDKNNAQIWEADPVDSFISSVYVTTSILDLTATVDLHDTLAGAKSRTDLVDNPANPMIVIISNRADGRFKVVSGETPNGFDIIAHDTLPIQLKLVINGVYNVSEFGGVGDGVGGTDDTDSLRATCNKISADGGGTLSGETGKSYLVSKTSVITTSDVTIDFNDSELVFVNDLVYDGIGEDGGNGTSYGGVLWFDSGNDSMTSTDNLPDPPANILSNLKIKNLRIRQTGTFLVNVQACRGLRFRSCDNVEITGCYFDSIKGEDINGWFFERNFRIHDNYFLNSVTLSVSMMLQNSECYNNKFFNCDQPYELTASDVRVYNNKASCTTTGNFIKISDSSRGYEQDIELFGNKVTGSFNSFFANEIIVSGDRFSRVHSHDNEINCEITSGRVYNLLPADGSWTFSDTISDKGINNALGFNVFLKAVTPESTLNGNYTICGMKKIVGWSSVGLSLLQDNLNQEKVAKVNYFNNTYVIKDGITDHPSQGVVAGSLASSLYRGSLFIDVSLVLNYVISNNIFDNGSETLIDRSPDVTALIGSETAFIYRGEAVKTMTRFFGKKGAILEISVPLDAPQTLTIEHNSNIVNTLSVDLVIAKGATVKYCFTEQGSKMFQMTS